MAGVGTILKRKLSWLPGGGCKSCNTLAGAMDAAGPDWCVARRDYLLDEMGKNAAGLGVPFLRFAASKILDSAIEEARLDLSQRAARDAMGFDAQVAAAIADIEAGPREREPRWQFRRDTLEATRRIINRRIAEIEMDNPPSFDPGCGIVTVGGSLRYFPSVYVLCNLLRETGCGLPIEVWYLGEGELDPAMMTLLESLGAVECRDVTAIDPPRRILGGWEAKAVAMRNSRFAEVLYLDADIVPARDPTYLFSDPRYLKSGVVAWPNFNHAVSYTATAEGFAVLDLTIPSRDPRKQFEHHAKPTDYTPWETGQLLVDKSKHWAAIELAAILGDYADVFYPRGQPVTDWHSYGDTQIFPWAFTRMGIAATMPAKPCDMFGDTSGGGLNQYDLDGQLCWQHRCQPQLKIRVSSANPSTGLDKPEAFESACASIKSLWRGSVWDWRDQTPAELALASQAAGNYFSAGLDVARPRILLRDGGKVDGGRNLRWCASIIGGVERIVIAETQRATAILTRFEHGWRDASATLYRCPPLDWRGIDSVADAIAWQDESAVDSRLLPGAIDGTVVVLQSGDGAAVSTCLSRGAKRVYAVESRPDKFAALVWNFRDDPRVDLIFRHADESDDDAIARAARLSGVDVERLIVSRIP